MKKLFTFITLMISLAGAASAQNFAPSAFTLTTANQSTANLSYDITGLGLGALAFSWSKTGTVSAGNCALLGSADNITFGTTIIAAQLVTTSGGPTALATGFTSNYIKISCTTPIAGSGKVKFKIFGWILNPVASVTVTGTVATTSANGSNVVLGSTTDDKCVTYDTTGCTDTALLKGIIYLLQTAVGPTTAANSNPYIQSFNTLVKGSITSAMTGTTSTAVGGTMDATASNYIYVTGCTTSNASTTVPTDIILQDGSGGTTLYTLPVPIGTGTGTGTSGGTYNFPSPLKLTVNTALYAANVTTGSSTKLSCNGFKSTVSY